MNLKDAKVIITGGSSGIGYATAQTLQAHGAQVLIASRNAEKLEKAAKALGVLSFQTDVSQEEEVKALFAFALQEMGDFNVLINNAGFGKMASLTETTTADFEAIWQVNTKGLFLVGREAARHFMSKKEGNIINIGSTAAQRGFATGSAYCASKFAVSGLTECWQKELRPYNVRVMQINPSEVITDFAKIAGYPQQDSPYKLQATEIAHAIKSVLQMNDIGFVPSLEVWATNPNR